VIVACDFFPVPSVSFQLLYCFFVSEHGRRKILHFARLGTGLSNKGVKRFPKLSPDRYVILDRGLEV
jgi:hypothetical protein